jgi:hypothetical protein
MISAGVCATAPVEIANAATASSKVRFMLNLHEIYF